MKIIEKKHFRNRNFMKITPDYVTELKSNEVFVFGSNENGIHGAGAAKLAHDKFGAVAGQGFGLSGRTFAIPTKDWHIQTLPLETISFYVHRFFDFVNKYKKLDFLVTEIGCGLAGFEPKDIAPLFRVFIKCNNIYLPKRFWDVLNKPEKKQCGIYTFTDKCGR